MSNESRPDTELTQNDSAVLKMIYEDTLKLRQLDLGETAPATVFEAG